MTRRSRLEDLHDEPFEDDADPDDVDEMGIGDDDADFNDLDGDEDADLQGLNGWP